MTRCCAALAGLVRREGSAGSVPGGTQVRVVRGWFGADRVVRMVVPGQLAVGADGGGFLLPGQARGGFVRDRAEGGDRPGKAAGGGVLADAASAVVHGGGKLGEEPVAFGVGGVGDLCGPSGGGERGEVAVAVADAGVDRGGDVADASQVAAGDRAGQDLAGVQARELGGAQGAVQPLLPVAGSCGSAPAGSAAGAGPGSAADGRAWSRRPRSRAGRPGGRRRPGPATKPAKRTVRLRRGRRSSPRGRSPRWSSRGRPGRGRGRRGGR